MRYIIIFLFLFINLYSQNVYQGIHTLKVEDNYIAFIYEAIYEDSIELQQVFEQIDQRMRNFDGLQNIERDLNIYYYENNIAKLMLFNSLVVLSENDDRLKNLSDAERLRYTGALSRILNINSRADAEKKKRKFLESNKL